MRTATIILPWVLLLLLLTIGCKTTRYSININYHIPHSESYVTIALKG